MKKDIIYREDAIEAIRRLPNAGIHWYISARAVFDVLFGLPSAHPNPSQCWGCNCPKMDARPENKELSHWKTDFKGYIDALDMPRDDYKGVMEYIEEVPSEQSEGEQRTTRRVVKNSGSTNWYECLRCGTAVDLVDKFCRGCGRRFEEEQ